jgi:hypothetical protein
MDRPETEPVYIERCLEAFIDALREADAMAHAGKDNEAGAFAANCADAVLTSR